jgi:hypothetical protein
MVWSGFIWFRIGTNGSLCEHGNEHSGSIKCWEMLEWLSNCWLLKKDSTLWRYLVYKHVQQCDLEPTHHVPRGPRHGAVVARVNHQTR